MQHRVIKWAQKVTPRWVVACAFGAGVLGGGVFAHLEARWPHWHVEFGDAPTWTGALGAIVAAGYAAGAFAGQRVQVAQLVRNAAAADRLLMYQDHAASQAFASAVRIDWKAHQRWRLTKHAVATMRVEGRVANGSGGAITNVVVRVHVDTTLLESFSLRPLRQSRDGEWELTWTLDLTHMNEVRKDVLDSGEGIAWSADVPGTFSVEHVHVVTRFTDEVRTRWQVGSDKTPVTVADGEW